MNPYNSYCEEEMVRLAEEISLHDEFALDWQPLDIIATRERIKICQELVNNLYDQYLSSQTAKQFIEDAEVKPFLAIFRQRILPELRSAVRSFSSSFSGKDISDAQVLQHASSSDRISLHDSSPLNAAALKDIEVTARSLASELKHHQCKIFKAIEHANTDSGILANLLELNDQISLHLRKIDNICKASPSQLPSILKESSNKDKDENNVVKTDNSLRFAKNIASDSFIPSVMAAVYAVRRGGGHDEVAIAVNNLATLCNLGGQVNLQAVRQMTSAGALQALLSLLPQASEWPDIELQISKVVSVVVTHEDDWALLQRSAVVILTSLYTLQLKTQSRARTRSDADLPESAVVGNKRHVRNLVAAAVDKLSRVLVSEWMKQGTSFASSFAPSMPVPSISALVSAHRSATGDAENVLQVLLNLIMFICDSPLFTSPSEVLASESTHSVLVSPQLSRQSSEEPPLPVPMPVPPSPTGGAIRFVSLGSRLEDSQNDSPTVYGKENSDLFLQSFYGISLDMLMTGDISTNRKPIDEDTVLCSASIAQLSELPQCRSSLVSRGVLRLIKSWFEVSATILEQLRYLLYEHSATVAAGSGLERGLFSLLEPVLRLISHASTAFMLLTGGRQTAANKDYIIGWIDAQIIAEGVVDAASRLLTAAHDIDKEDPASTRPLRNILPAAVALHLSQAVRQLCSRPQNRHRMKESKLPQALCFMFESALIHMPDVLDGVLLISDQSAAADAAGHDRERREFHLRLFTFGIFDASVQMSLEVHEFSRASAVSPLTPLTPHSPVPARSATQTQSQSHSPVTSAMQVLSAVSATCLDAITFFFNDEKAQYQYDYSQGGASLSMTEQSSRPSSSRRLSLSFAMPESNSSSLAFPASLSSSTIILNNRTISHRSLLEVVCSSRFISSVLAATSNLPRGPGRLACVKAICALSELPQCLHALYHGGVMDALVFIISQANEENLILDGRKVVRDRERDRDRERGSTSRHESKDGSSPILSNANFPSKPGPIERGTSGGSNISGMSSSANSGLRSLGMGPFSSSKAQSILKIPSTDTDIRLFEEERRRLELSIEETLAASWTLANLCEADVVYAKRMFSSGLFDIMTKLIQHSRIEVSREALRSMYFMCKTVSLHELDETKSHAFKLKRNEGLMESLECLIEVLTSATLPIQKGAIDTIAQLALIGEEFQDKIVDECLRTIISLLVNPRTEKELKASAEEVLRNIGFSGGIKDFELCGFDFEILKDWYSIQRSLKPQDHALSLLKEWIYRLFSDEEERAVRQKERPEKDAYELLTEATLALHTNFSIDTMPPYLKKDPEAQPAKGLAGLAIPQLQRNFTDSILKFLPFCLPRSNSGQEGGNSLSFGFGVEDDGIQQPRKSRSNKESSSFSASSFPAGQTMMMHHRSPSQGNHPIVGQPHSHQTNDKVTPQDLYPWIDSPPVAVLHLLDLFYTSRMHQLVLMDLNSLGACMPVSLVLGIGDKSVGSRYLVPQEQQEMAFLIPAPHNVRAILLPSRMYQSFARVGRVLQRMLDHNPGDMGSARKSGIPQLWALSFRDSDFFGEFHTSLLGFLHRCPQICSVSFSSSRRVEEDALLGHLVGQLPNTVRFVSFKGTLSRESVQALCITLRNHARAAAAAEAQQYTAATSSSTSPTAAASASAATATPTSFEKGGSGKSDGSNLTFNINRGLMGLALTHLTFEGPEITKLCELLNPRLGHVRSPTTPITPAKASAASAVAGATATPSATPRPPSVPSTPMTLELGGLRYLDLSHNSLSDSSCALLLLAAMKGPLEGLELGGNAIATGTKFVEALGEIGTSRGRQTPPVGQTSSTPMNRLRYLGLSQNGLTASAVSVILRTLRSNTSLTSLDLSANGLEASPANHKNLRAFVEENEGLRQLDLSYNRLAPESYRELYLGLLENSVLLRLPLVGNLRVDYERSVELIQQRLRDNRLHYKECSRGFLGGSGYYQTEDVTSRLTFSDMEGSARSSDAEIAETEAHVEIQQAEEEDSSVSASRLPVASAVAMLLRNDSDDDAQKTDSGSNKLLSLQNPGVFTLATAAVELVPSPSTAVATRKRTSSAPTAILSADAKLSTSLGSAAAPPGSPATRPRRPSMSHKEKDKAGDATSKATEELRDGEFPLLHVLFSTPLAGFDRTSRAHPMEVLDYNTERDALTRVFQECSRAAGVHFDFATSDALRTLLSRGAKALHFSGHGLPSGLCFEDGRGGLQVMRAAMLKDLLGAGGLSLRFVFVSACHSREVGEAFSRAGVPHVVCVKVDARIQDAAAHAFTRAFYVAFLSGRSVKDSFSIAKEALKASPYVPDSVLEGEKFVLLPDIAGDEHGHDEAIFGPLPTLPEWPGASSLLCTVGPKSVDSRVFFSGARARLPSAPADFEGRELAMHALLRALLDRRLVSLVGEEGIGKSAVSAAVCAYAADRDLFRGPIIFVKGKGILTFRAFLARLRGELLQSAIAVASLPSAVAAVATAAAAANSVLEEDAIVAALHRERVLLVLDHIEELLVEQSGQSFAEFRLFLSRLMEECPQVRVLYVGVDTLAMHNVHVSAAGVVEYSVPLGPLSLHGALRLFARLAPALPSAADKAEFCSSLQPAKALPATLPAREATAAAAQVLMLIGDGHPARIVHMACESTTESVEDVKREGARILKSAASFHLQQMQQMQQALESQQQQQSGHGASVPAKEMSNEQFGRDG